MNISSRRLMNALLALGLFAAASGPALAHTGGLAPSGHAAPGWTGGYHPVTPGVMQGIQNFLRTDAGITLLSQTPSLSVLKRLNADSEVHRTIVATISTPQLRAAVQSNDAGQINAEVARILALHTTYGLQSCAVLAAARARDVIAQVRDAAINVSELSQAASELAPFADMPDVNGTKNAIATVASLAAEARSERGMAAASSMAFGLQVTAQVESIGRGGASQSIGEQHENTVRALLEELHNSPDEAYSRKLIGLLRALPGQKDGAAIERRVAASISLDLAAESGRKQNLAALRTMKILASSSDFDDIRSIAIERVMRYFENLGKVGLVDEALGVIDAAIGSTPNEEVKGLALNLLLHVRTSENLSDTIKNSLQARIDAITASMGTLTHVPAPQAPEEPAPADSDELDDSTHRALPAGESLSENFSYAAAHHPVGMFFALLGIALTVGAMITGALPPIMVISTLPIMLYVGLKGLASGHPVANFFQLGLIGGLFTAPRAAELSLGSGLGIVAAAAACAALALWSFRNNRPVLGFFLNVVLSYLLSMLVLGASAV